MKTKENDKIDKIRRQILTGKDQIEEAKRYMITEHEHNNRGGAVMLMCDYERLLDNYELFVQFIEEIIDKK